MYNGADGVKNEVGYFMIERTSHPVGSYASLVFNQVDHSLSFGVAAWVRFAWSFQLFHLLLYRVSLRYQAVMLFLGMLNLLV